MYALVLSLAPDNPQVMQNGDSSRFMSCLLFIFMIFMCDEMWVISWGSSVAVSGAQSTGQPHSSPHRPEEKASET